MAIAADGCCSMVRINCHTYRWTVGHRRATVLLGILFLLAHNVPMVFDLADCVFHLTVRSKKKDCDWFSLYVLPVLIVASTIASGSLLIAGCCRRVRRPSRFLIPAVLITVDVSRHLFSLPQSETELQDPLQHRFCAVHGCSHRRRCEGEAPERGGGYRCRNTGDRHDSLHSLHVGPHPRLAPCTQVREPSDVPAC